MARKIVTACAALLIVSCSPKTPRTEPSGAADQMGASVTVKVFQFQPSPLEVRVGDTVTWTNEDDIEHTVTSGEPGNPAGGFDGPLNGTSATFRHRFGKSGTFPYFCSIHESMRGEIRVSG
ncbi:MAG: cupredoxin domain-containing protein [Actinomycetota bacterium]